MMKLITNCSLVQSLTEMQFMFDSTKPFFGPNWLAESETAKLKPWHQYFTVLYT